MSKLRIASILFLFSTVILKFSSMFRDLIIANYFGDSYAVDAYIAAMTIPNAIILFMLTGMKDAFVPSYYKYKELGLGEQHKSHIVKGTFWVCFILSVIGIIISSPLVHFLYPNFPTKGLEVATWTAIIYFSSIVMVGVNAVYEGYFDAEKMFSFSVFSQTLVVLVTIVSAILFHQNLGIYSVPIGYFMGTVLSLILKFLVLQPRKKFILWKQKLDINEVKMFYLIFIPVGLTIAVGQINLFVNTLFAAQLGEGVVANLNYAFRLVSIPQAIFGVTIATIIYPMLAEAKSKNNIPLFKKGIEKGLVYMFLFVAPTVAGMMVLIKPIVRVVYERGAFDTDATLMTSELSIFYIGSVLFYSIQAVVAKGFYTLEKGHYMFRIGMTSIVLNVIFNAIFAHLLGAKGLALSASLVGLCYSVITFSTLYKLVKGFNKRYLVFEYGKILISTLLMASIVFYISKLVFIQSLNIYVMLLLVICMGALVYFASLYLFKTSSFKELLNSNKIKIRKMN
ncbi:murein biosynthesis integral membrane protein MurJ [Robertmurraya kyonggiensis]|uniref:Murein biosynthesis protein MurJ n=1 Tax=Robertmurraya kyonggiensis TaxID=1037680 RepID=A0A4U1D3T1_9BACI|nr:lipid II flippase MurJ [Robertmurraya kyonggiensis]TKC17002.1 murein biosynthesis protein MurJ [Robertmurraya kyonggiensis]